MRHIYFRRVFGTVLILLAATAFAQAPEDEEIFVPTYSLGDQTLAINLGLFAPLFITGGAEGISDGITRPNLTLGGVGSIAWGSHLTNEIKLGVEVGGSFSFTPNRRPLFLVPITFESSYLLQAYPLEFPVTLGLGMSFARLGEDLKLDPFIRPGGGIYWNYSSQWAFGAKLRYWIIPQIYSARSEAGRDESRIGNFLELSLSALYRF